MEKVLRYESRVQKQLDWALQKLLECPNRRAKNPSAAWELAPIQRDRLVRTTANKVILRSRFHLISL